MIKKTILAIPVIVTLALSGCAGGKPDWRQVQEYAVAICGFFPETNTVQQMLVSPNATVFGLWNLAQAICTTLEVPNEPLGLTSECPYGEVNGVCISGTFVDGDKNNEGDNEEE